MLLRHRLNLKLGWYLYVRVLELDVFFCQESQRFGQ